MAKARLLSKVIILSEKLNSVSEGAENLYYRLLVISDDYGRYHARPEIIKGKALTLRKISTTLISKRLKELWEIRLIKLYNIKNEIYLEINDFELHQRFRSDIKRKEDFLKPVTYLEKFVTSCSVSERKVESTSDLTNRNRNNNSNDNKDKERKRIIDYFNETTGQKRSYDSDNTNKFINGRLEEGKTFEDFKHVIDTKTSQWLKDEKMGKYLRPSTLFTPGKFEDYLNEPYEDPKRKKYRVGENVEKPTKEEDEFTKARNVQIEKICKSHEKEIEQARKDGDKDKYDKIQNQIKIELADWSKEYNKSKPSL